MTRKRWTWKEPPGLHEDIEKRLAERFLTGVYEAALAAGPTEVDVLVALGDLYTRQGLFEKGLAIDQRLVAVRPDEPMFHYNLACSHSLLGNLDTAFESLSRAVQLGYDEIEHMIEDPDLANLRRDLRWRELLAKLKQKRKHKHATG